jgi:hypothetical protein
LNPCFRIYGRGEWAKLIKIKFILDSSFCSNVTHHDTWKLLNVHNKKDAKNASCVFLFPLYGGHKAGGGGGRGGGVRGGDQVSINPIQAMQLGICIC